MVCESIPLPILIDCEHLGQSIGQRISSAGNTPAHACSVFGETTIRWCKTCPSRSRRKVKDFAGVILADEKKSPPAEASVNPDTIPFTDRKGNALPLQDMWRGGHLFVVLSGPSNRDADLSVLNQRGIMTMCVNNSPAIWRPHLWIHGDPCDKFHHAIWRDPAILKFTPWKFAFKDATKPKNGYHVREKVGGQFSLSEELAKDMPGVVLYKRNAYFDPENFLSEPSVNWGNSKDSVAKNKGPHVLNIMLAVMKLPYLLGFRNIYLLGADFRMTDNDQPYAFDQIKTDGAVGSNNSAYTKINHMLNLLRPKFDAAGYSVWNCTPKSCLLAFPRLTLEEAIARARAAAKIESDKLDTADWYTSEEARPEKKKRRGRRGRN